MKNKLYIAILLLSMCLSLGAQNKLQILAKAAIPTAYKTLIDSNRIKIDNDDIAFQSVNIANAILKKVR